MVPYRDTDGVTELGKFCGSQLPTELLVSSGNTMLIQFFSNAAKVKTGFRATWDASGTVCS